MEGRPRNKGRLLEKKGTTLTIAFFRFVLFAARLLKNGAGFLLVVNQLCAFNFQ